MADKITLFGKKEEKPDPAKEQEKQVQQTHEADILRDIKILEEKILGLDKKIEVVENNLVEDHKGSKEDLNDLHKTVTELQSLADMLKKRVTEIITDMKNFARHEEVDTMKKYLDLWQPLNFVTREELNQILNERLGK